MTITQAMEITYTEVSVYLTQTERGNWEVQDEAEECLLFLDSSLPLNEVIEEAEAEATKLRLESLRQEKEQIEEHITELEQEVKNKTGPEPDPEQDAAHQQWAKEAREPKSKAVEELEAVADRYIEFADGSVLIEVSPYGQRTWQLFDPQGKALTSRVPAEANNLPNLVLHVGENPNGDGCIATESSYVIYSSQGIFQGYDFFATVNGVYPETKNFFLVLKR